MKKIVTLALLFAGAFTSAAYAQGNLFTPADCDANGWLWFDTQAKIDKYVGDANSDKIIKMVPTKYQVEVEPDIFENLKNTASPTVYGAGTDGYLPGVDSTGATLGADAKQGAIVLAPATNAIMAMNGGGILMHLQSCYSLNMFFSCEGHIKPVLQGVDGTKETIDCSQIKSFPFTPLNSAYSGQTTWNNMQDIENAFSFKLKSENPVTMYLLSGTNNDLYLHGIKALVYGEGAGISGTASDAEGINIAQTGRFISLSREADINVYNAAGKVVLSTRAEALDLGVLGTGLYIVQARDAKAVATQKVLIP